ncbi:WD40-repeat-containing domain protein [Xylaria bambusicola]|uniref:WD40-repeat-containing domain protein n=1 Tax=Xylaria bambusicola TaxID=326684 RepID=UPI0020088696|nr:WD40-repeat-containing domain protein [Xylaria bambusicola]KAI0506607.1 WD40-repeat-containing domain protein [Xylaria bambusicola]
MATTPSHRLRLTPANSPFLPRPSRSPHRGRTQQLYDSRLSLKRVIGTTCLCPTGFDAVQSSFAYVAGGAVVVVDVNGDSYAQRFFRARPTAVPVYSTPSPTYSTSSPSTPKANDSRNRISLRESVFSPPNDWAESPSTKTWTSRERIKAATCLALSKEGKFLAVGETGYAPRVLIYSLEDDSSDSPLVSISEHAYGVKAVAWSPDSKFLASLGSSNDGFLYVWKIDPKTGAARLFQQNRCTTYIKGMIWMGNNLITLGVRHVKVWRIDEAQATSPVKQKFIGDMTSNAQPQKTLPGRNVLLGSMIEATFSCAATIDDTKAIICSETGDVCLLDDLGKQTKLTHLLETGFVTTCVALRNGLVYIGGKSGNLATIDLESLLKGSNDSLQTATETFAGVGILALGFVEDKLITIDSKRSIDIWNQDHTPRTSNADPISVPIPGCGDAAMGIGSLSQSNVTGAQFYTWSQSGYVILWSTDGTIKSSFQVPLDEACFEDEPELVNHMATIRATKDGKYFIAGDRLGFVKVIDFATKECVSSMKAHSSDCQFIAIYENESSLLIASCGRDRTAQLFHRLCNGEFEHFQTLEFAARVSQVLIPSTDKVITCSLDRAVQIHDLVTKEGDPDIMAAIPSRTLAIKASPISMAMGPDGKTLYVSQVERSVSMFDLITGKLLKSFKCFDESGADPVILDSLTTRAGTEKEPAFLLGLSNTDKSIRIYDIQGQFLAREWGHTEAIHGVAMIEEDDANRKAVSVGSDGTIMIWEIDLQDRGLGSSSRDSSPAKEATTPINQPTLRRVLSRTELAEFQRPASAAGGRRSPPRTLSKRRSLFLGNYMSPAASKTPVAGQPSSPAPVIAEDTPSRRPSGTPAGSPPVSPRARTKRRPSVPALNSAKTKSNGSLRSYGTLNKSTEQTSRTLRAYRKKLASTDPISQETLAELDQELRLTAVALGDRATRSKAMSDTMLNGLLDQYSERLVSLLDEKLRLGKYRRPSDPETDSTDKRPSSSGTGSSSTST